MGGLSGLASHSYRIPWAIAVGATLLGLWGLLSGGEGWVYGIPAAALGAWVSAWLAPGELHQPRPLGIIRFLWVFLVQSLVGGIDVARRALSPTMAVTPGWQEYTISLNTPVAQSLFLITVSLTPGTLCADLRGDVMRIHTLSPEMGDSLPKVERAVAGIFGGENQRVTR